MRIRNFVLPVLVCLATFAPAAPAAAPGPVEDYSYDYARKCVKRPAKGMLAMQAWLERNTRGESWGIMRCERLSGKSYSLHSEGRAIDWRLDALTPAGRRAAERLIKRLLAPDAEGNSHALARRMGIQEVIFNCRSWWAGPRGMKRYSVCFDRRGRRRPNVNATLAHRDHVHIGLSRAGARMRTSFWAAR